MAVRAPALLPAPALEGDEVRFLFRERGEPLAGVRLADSLARPRTGREFARSDQPGVWQLRLPLPAADRIEYTLELTHADGSAQHVCDPANPRRVRGVFGDRSVVELPGYRPPAWLDAGRRIPKGRVDAIELHSRTLSATFEAQLWTSPGSRPTRELPLLVVHDGPEYARYAALLEFLDRMRAERRIPPLRAALLPPVDRNETYSASAAYAGALVRELLPQLRRAAPTPAGRSFRLGMGASLGALAMLHAQRLHHDAFGGLLLQSGSFFRQRTDRQESGFPRFGRITRFIGRVLRGEGAEPIPVAITCGAAEENLANNRTVGAALAAQGYGVHFHVQRDAHTWVCWRDSYDPPLVDLIRRVLG